LLPFTLNGYHSQNWIFRPEVVESAVADSHDSEIHEIIIEIGMATGKSARKTVRLDNNFMSLDNMEYRSGDS
jgi:16S rRNA A1518/A1519 N6-dimethyltransferase RsmA/KsgA/DIM1 with predicted DNA glycosylase/AP lyase activity